MAAPSDTALDGAARPAPHTKVLHRSSHSVLPVAVGGDGPDVVSDDDVVEYLRNFGNTGFHPTSTCRMGVDPTAVVDPRLRVHGLEGLRVVDASIMPAVTSGNTNAPTIMLAEKASDMIREDARSEPARGAAA